MKKGDIQKAMPGILYTNTKANVEALTGVVEGAQAFASDTHLIGWYNGTVWIWPGRVLIQELTPAGGTTASFTSIPAFFKKLTIEMAIRSTVNATACNGYLTFNGDATAGNYGYSEIYTYLDQHGANGSSARTLFTTGVNGDISPADEFTHGILEILQYANTNINKHSQYHGSHKRDSTTLYIVNYVSSTYWLSKTAINRVDIALQSGNYTANSVLRLYGES